MITVDRHFATVVATSGGEMDGGEETKAVSPEHGLVVKEDYILLQCTSGTQKSGLAHNGSSIKQRCRLREPVNFCM